MKTQDFPPAEAGQQGQARFTHVSATAVVRRIADRFTYPAEKPFVTLLLYYALLVGAGAAAVRWIPGALEMISGRRLLELGRTGQSVEGVLQDPSPAFAWQLSGGMALAMIGAFLLMLPASWVYMAERRRKGFDQSVIQTMIILAVAVAGVVIIARNSVALAFSLAGVVGAVRFRNNLTDTRDTLYIFLAIGVGLAAGVEALTAALVLSACFNFIVLLLFRNDYGMCELGRSPGHLLVGASAVASPDEKRKAVKDFNAVLLVRATDTDRARPAVEAILATEVRRFRLAEIEASGKGKGVLKYLVRLGKGSRQGHLEDALLERGAPTVIGARIH